MASTASTVLNPNSHHYLEKLNDANKKRVQDALHGLLDEFMQVDSTPLDPDTMDPTTLDMLTDGSAPDLLNLHMQVEDELTVQYVAEIVMVRKPEHIHSAEDLLHHVMFSPEMKKRTLVRYNESVQPTGVEYRWNHAKWKVLPPKGFGHSLSPEDAKFMLDKHFHELPTSFGDLKAAMKAGGNGIVNALPSTYVLSAMYSTLAHKRNKAHKHGWRGGNGISDHEELIYHFLKMLFEPAANDQCSVVPFFSQGGDLLLQHPSDCSASPNASNQMYGAKLHDDFYPRYAAYTQPLKEMGTMDKNVMKHVLRNCFEESKLLSHHETNKNKHGRKQLDEDSNFLVGGKGKSHVACGVRMIHAIFHHPTTKEMYEGVEHLPTDHARMMFNKPGFVPVLRVSVVPVPIAAVVGGAFGRNEFGSVQPQSCIFSRINWEKVENDDASDSASSDDNDNEGEYEEYESEGYASEENEMEEYTMPAPKFNFLAGNAGMLGNEHGTQHASLNIPEQHSSKHVVDGVFLKRQRTKLQHALYDNYWNQSALQRLFMNVFGQMVYRHTNQRDLCEDPLHGLELEKLLHTLHHSLHHSVSETFSQDALFPQYTELARSLEYAAGKEWQVAIKNNLASIQSSMKLLGKLGITYAGRKALNDLLSKHVARHHQKTDAMYEAAKEECLQIAHLVEKSPQQLLFPSANHQHQQRSWWLQWYMNKDAVATFWEKELHQAFAQVPWDESVPMDQWTGEDIHSIQTTLQGKLDYVSQAFFLPHAWADAVVDAMHSFFQDESGLAQLYGREMLDLCNLADDKWQVLKESNYGKKASKSRNPWIPASSAAELEAMEKEQHKLAMLRYIKLRLLLLLKKTMVIDAYAHKHGGHMVFSQTQQQYTKQSSSSSSSANHRVTKLVKQGTDDEEKRVEVPVINVADMELFPPLPNANLTETVVAHVQQKGMDAELDEKLEMQLEEVSMDAAALPFTLKGGFLGAGRRWKEQQQQSKNKQQQYHNQKQHLHEKPAFIHSHNPKEKNLKTQAKHSKFNKGKAAFNAETFPYVAEIAGLSKHNVAKYVHALLHSMMQFVSSVNAVTALIQQHRNQHQAMEKEEMKRTVLKGMWTRLMSNIHANLMPVYMEHMMERVVQETLQELHGILYTANGDGADKDALIQQYQTFKKNTKHTAATGQEAVDKALEESGEYYEKLMQKHLASLEEDKQRRWEHMHRRMHETIHNTTFYYMHGPQVAFGGAPFLSAELDALVSRLYNEKYLSKQQHTQQANLHNDASNKWSYHLAPGSIEHMNVSKLPSLDSPAESFKMLGGCLGRHVRIRTAESSDVSLQNLVYSIALFFRSNIFPSIADMQPEILSVHFQYALHAGEYREMDLYCFHVMCTLLEQATQTKQEYVLDVCVAAVHNMHKFTLQYQNTPESRQLKLDLHMVGDVLLPYPWAKKLIGRSSIPHPTAEMLACTELQMVPRLFNYTKDDILAILKARLISDCPVIFHGPLLLSNGGKDKSPAHISIRLPHMGEVHASVVMHEKYLHSRNPFVFFGGIPHAYNMVFWERKEGHAELLDNVASMSPKLVASMKEVRKKSGFQGVILALHDVENGDEDEKAAKDIPRATMDHIIICQRVRAFWEFVAVNNAQDAQAFEAAYHMQLLPDLSAVKEGLQLMPLEQWIELCKPLKRAWYKRYRQTAGFDARAMCLNMYEEQYVFEVREKEGGIVRRTHYWKEWALQSGFYTPEQVELLFQKYPVSLSMPHQQDSQTRVQSPVTQGILQTLHLLFTKYERSMQLMQSMERQLHDKMTFGFVKGFTHKVIDEKHTNPLAESVHPSYMDIVVFEDDCLLDSEKYELNLSMQKMHEYLNKSMDNIFQAMYWMCVHWKSFLTWNLYSNFFGIKEKEFWGVPIYEHAASTAMGKMVIGYDKTHSKFRKTANKLSIWAFSMMYKFDNEWYIPLLTQWKAAKERMQMPRNLVQNRIQVAMQQQEFQLALSQAKEQAKEVAKKEAKEKAKEEAQKAAMPKSAEPLSIPSMHKSFRGGYPTPFLYNLIKEQDNPWAKVAALHHDLVEMKINKASDTKMDECYVKIASEITRIFKLLYEDSKLVRGRGGMLTKQVFFKHVCMKKQFHVCNMYVHAFAGGQVRQGLPGPFHWRAAQHQHARHGLRHPVQVPQDHGAGGGRDATESVVLQNF